MDVISHPHLPAIAAFFDTLTHTHTHTHTHTQTHTQAHTHTHTHTPRCGHRKWMIRSRLDYCSNFQSRKVTLNQW